MTQIGYAVLISPTLLVTHLFLLRAMEGSSVAARVEALMGTLRPNKVCPVTRWRKQPMMMSQLMGWQRFRSILAAERFILAQSEVSFSVYSFSTISSILSIILCFLPILHSPLLCPSLRLSYLQTLGAASHLSVCQWLGNWSCLGHKIQVGGGRNVWWTKHLFNLKLGLDHWANKAGLFHAP